MEQSPLCFQFIAFYSDGQCLPEFDPETGKHNGFLKVDQDRLDSFGLFPFTPKMVEKIKEHTKAIFKILPSYVVKVNKGQKLIYHRTGRIDHKKIPFCSECKKTFEFGGLIDNKCPCGNEVKLIKIENHRYYYVIGFQETKETDRLRDGVNFKSVLTIDGNGKVILSDKFMVDYLVVK